MAQRSGQAARRAGAALPPSSLLALLSAVAVMVLCMWLWLYDFTGAGVVVGKRRLALHCSVQIAGDHASGRPVDAGLSQTLSVMETPYALQRRAVYDRLGEKAQKLGLKAVLQSVDSAQGLKKTDFITPVLKRLQQPVRAIVLPLHDPAVVQSLEEATRTALGSSVQNVGIYYQDASLYHISFYHASHHLTPVSETTGTTDVEMRAVAGVACKTGAMQLILDRVLLTSTGSVLACWQVASGPEPLLLRQQLRKALPNASSPQLVKDQEIVYSTLARIIDLPAGSHGQMLAKPGNDATFAQELEGLNRALCGLKAYVTGFSYVLEYDLLALGLSGSLKAWDIPFRDAAGNNCDVIY
eukprot:jgi/Chlat1/6192/Chrsp427S05728